MKKKLFILGASSDIGNFLIKSYSEKYDIIGTYRSKKNLGIFKKDKRFFKCDLNNFNDKKNLINEIYKKKFRWDVVIFSVGDLSPIGSFENINFKKFNKSLQSNLIGPLEVLNKILKFRNSKGQKKVIFFSGSGTNDIQKNYSCYTISKIALIKATEQFNEEINDVAFTILGPGWVNTKIHLATSEYKNIVPKNYLKFLKISKKSNLKQMIQIKKFIDWIIASKKKVIGGRNFSIKNDPVYNQKFIKLLIKDKDFFKLRRYGNNYKL